MIGLGGRGVMGLGLGRSSVAAAAVPWWLAGGAPTPVAAYQPIGAASLAASYVNLANPGTNDAAPGVAPTFDAATGWFFDVSTQYLVTGVVPSSLAWSMIVRVYSYTAMSYVAIAGASTGTTGNARFALWAQSIPSAVGYINGGLREKAPRLDSNGGVLAVAGNQGYRNGISDGAVFTQGTQTTNAIVIGKDSRYLTMYGLNGIISAIAIYGTTLDAAQVAQISAAMAAL